MSCALVERGLGRARAEPEATFLAAPRGCGARCDWLSVQDLLPEPWEREPVLKPPDGRGGGVAAALLPGVHGRGFPGEVGERLAADVDQDAFHGAADQRPRPRPG